MELDKDKLTFVAPISNAFFAMVPGPKAQIPLLSGPQLLLEISMR